MLSVFEVLEKRETRMRHGQNEMKQSKRNGELCSYPELVVITKDREYVGRYGTSWEAHM